MRRTVIRGDTMTALPIQNFRDIKKPFPKPKANQLLRGVAGTWMMD